MKHTKGKWSISGSGNKDFKLCIVAEDRGSICHITNWSEARANANVIAKVPEMIEALKEVDKLLEEYFEMTGHNNRESAIARKVNSLVNEIES